jgi:hypothetical protein
VNTDATIDAISNEAFKAKAFALLDAMADAGMGDKEIGLVLFGMAVSALVEGGLTRDLVHGLVDTLLNERGVA